MKKSVFTRCVSLLSLPLMLAACSGPTLKGSFGGFNRSYGDTLNEQMLLNIARLQNGHPPYFLAIGAITNKFTFGGEVSGGGAWSDTEGGNVGRTRGTQTSENYGQTEGVLGLLSKTVQRTVGATVGATVGSVTNGNVGGGFSASSSPEFQFIPLNNSDVSQQLLQPISPKIFYTLYEQGFPVDMLMRVLVERADLKVGKQTFVLENSPTYGNRGKLVDNPGDGIEECFESSYSRFLRACDMLRELQLEGLLSLNIETSSNVISKSSTPPDGDHLLAASASGLSYEKTDDGFWGLVKRSSETSFYIRPGDIGKCTEHLVGEGFLPEAVDHLVKILKRDGAPSAEREAAATTLKTGDGDSVGVLPGLDQVAATKGTIREKIRGGLKAVSRVSTLSTDIPAKENTDDGFSSTLVLRSYSRALEAVASEQVGFEELDEMKGKALKDDWMAIVRPEERVPILKTVWKASDGPLERSLFTLRYAGKTYKITDKSKPERANQKRWNRDVFRLLVALSSQVSVDIAKYQRSVIELR